MRRSRSLLEARSVSFCTLARATRAYSRSVPERYSDHAVVTSSKAPTAANAAPAARVCHQRSVIDCALVVIVAAS